MLKQNNKQKINKIKMAPRSQIIFVISTVILVLVKYTAQVHAQTEIEVESTTTNNIVTTTFMPISQNATAENMMEVKF